MILLRHRSVDPRKLMGSPPSWKLFAHLLVHRDDAVSRCRLRGPSKMFAAASLLFRTHGPGLQRKIQGRTGVLHDDLPTECAGTCLVGKRRLYESLIGQRR